MFDEAKHQFHHPFFLEVGVIASGTMWRQRNAKCFKNKDPSFSLWKAQFRNEVALFVCILKVVLKTLILDILHVPIPLK